MIPRLSQFCVLVVCISKFIFGTIDVLLPIDAVRVSTVVNSSSECFEQHYDMPLVFWEEASLERKLTLIQSLSEQDVTVKRGKFIYYFIIANRAEYDHVFV